jgi:hypothetical protein
MGRKKNITIVPVLLETGTELDEVGGSAEEVSFIQDGWVSEIPPPPKGGGI